MRTWVRGTRRRSGLPHCLTFLWAAAGARAARTADVAAALLRAALAAADAQQQDEQQSPQDDEQDRQPVCGEQRGQGVTEHLDIGRTGMALGTGFEYSPGSPFALKPKAHGRAWSDAQ